jgi:photosystem II stability/assembly factor-like uncharacterized protein
MNTRRTIVQWLALTLALGACGDGKGMDEEPEDAGLDAREEEPDEELDADGEEPDAGMVDAAPPPDPYLVCSPDDWCFARPRPTDRALFAGSVSGGNVWLVGENGTLLSFDGKGVRGLESGVDRSLRATHALSASDVWAVGDRTTILHYTGESFARVDVSSAADAGVPDASTGDAGAPAGPALNGVWAIAKDDVWAVGEQGALYHYDGQNFSAQTSPTSEALNAVIGFAKDKVFAVGNSGALLRYNGIDRKDVV